MFFCLYVLVYFAVAYGLLFIKSLSSYGIMMGIKINDGRIKGDKPSQKKPYKGFNKNRKGSKKESNGLGCKIEHNRIKPKISQKKDRRSGRVSLNPDKPVLFTLPKYRKRQDDIRSLEVCQVCEACSDLDAPHHVLQGLGVKDDRYLINICIICHGIIHTVGYMGVKKTREECEEIAWSNHLKFEEEL